MKSIAQKSTLVDLMIWFAIFGIQAAVAIFTYGQSSTAVMA
jgi:Tfp pilus assembly protein PilE